VTVDTTSGHTVVVLAGGKGTRLKEVVSNVPKPLASIRNRPFLEYLLSYWIKNNAHHFILSVGYKYQQIMDHFGSTFNSIPITYVVEDEPLGTGGALLKVLDENNLKEDFFLVNGDTLFLVDPERMKEIHTSSKANLTLSLRQVENAGRYHRMTLNEAGKLITIEQPNKKAEPGQVNGGVYIVNSRIFREWPDTRSKSISFENDILPIIISNHNVYGISDDGDFIDIGIPEDFYKAQTYLNDDLLISKGAQ
jgi:D-glycero-alpha-D-manno-heptose 1-phosphate guanylyltransferase